ncbi:MAG: hypothetical protein K9L68_06035 [Spirochaetales bacterium]|nr:hypothetical protein [Spirochaetales bacterium]MCF7938141.1 hypothetical protein [Spirochaetales bacterium]
MIEAIPSSSNIAIANLVRATTTSNRISVPIRQSNVYARFKHVFGVPSGTNQDGVSLLKLKALDSMIDRLSTLHGEQASSIQARRVTEQNIDSLLEETRNALQGAVASRHGYGLSGLNATGELVDFFA